MRSSATVAGSLTWFSAVISSRKLPGASWISTKLMITTPRTSGTACTRRRRSSLNAARWREPMDREVIDWPPLIPLPREGER